MPNALNPEEAADEWKIAGEKTKKRLPATRLKISDNALDHYCNPINIQKEILRSKPELNPSLVKIANLSGDRIIVATDDAATHSLLEQDWPSDAFHNDISIVPPRDLQTTSMVIRGIHQSLVIDQGIIQQLADQGAIEPNRIISKATGKPTTFLRITATKKASEILLSNGISFRFRVEPNKKPLQCFKCQQHGHTASTCINQQKCVRCKTATSTAHEAA